uniref:Uncharacterized protein n=1 Tax=Arundo donax TaxID=35708 RepID=A0A0A9HLE7_ARUDO
MADMTVTTRSFHSPKPSLICGHGDDNSHNLGFGA